MLKRIFLLCFLLFVVSRISLSQINRWETYTDFKNVIAVSADPGSRFIYSASRGGLFVLDQTNGEIVKKFTNLNGLISTDLTSLVIDDRGKLWAGASDGSIAIYDISSGTWRYIYDIKNSTESDKTINAFIQSGNFMLVATGYGIHKIAVTDFSFVDAPYVKLGDIAVNTPVNALTINNGFLFAATKAGVAYANMLTSNLNDPSSWSTYRISPMNADVQTVESFDNNVFAGSTTGFMYFNGSSWLSYPEVSVSSSNTKDIKAIGNNLYFISGNLVYFANRSNLSIITQFNAASSYTTIAIDNDLNPIAGTSDNGILIKIGNQYIYDFPNGPFTNSFNHLAIDDNGNVWAAAGTGTGGFYMFSGEIWENYNTQSHPEIGSSNSFQKIAVGNGNVWALSFGGGAVLLQNGIVTNTFNSSNSNLPGIGTNADSNFIATFGGEYDNNGVFWLTFFLTHNSRSLYAYTGSPNWTGINNLSVFGNTALSEIAVDSYNTKWIVARGSRNGVAFFNENGTLTNFSDDIYSFYNKEDFGSEVNTIVDVIVDKNNEVWIATDNGVFIIRSPLAAIQNPNQKPRPEKLGIISGGFRVPFTENCTSISTDILNDKWVGTETNGVFHLSSDGNTLIKQFNTTNSPILSNRVLDVKVSNISGRAYFATLSGLSSYLTDAIEPVAEFDKIISSPNPYIIPSGTVLKIDGLIENSRVKIIKLNGEVVTEFDSPGGRIASWNGVNDKNELVSSGIYIIVAYNKDGTQVGTGKVAIVRK